VPTYGETREAALHRAVDAIETMLASLISRGAPVQRAKRGRRLRNNEALVKLPNLSAAKLELYWALKDAGITRAHATAQLEARSIGCSDLITRSARGGISGSWKAVLTQWFCDACRSGAGPR